jgi:hypothetical protein
VPEGGDPRRSSDLGAVGLACAGPIPPRGGEIGEKKMRRAGGEKEKGSPAAGGEERGENDKWVPPEVVEMELRYKGRWVR